MSTAAVVVVACRLPGALRLGERPDEAIARFDSLSAQASALGGTVVASGYDSRVFSWPEASIQEAVSFAATATHAPPGGEPVWACGVASGEVTFGRPPGPGALPLPWGEPLAVASALARIAKPREVLVDVSVPAVVSHDLLTNRARVGQVGGRRVRGFRVDSRQAWRAVAAADVARMVDAPLIGRDEEFARLMAAQGVIILRADSGFGGSRILAEVAAKTKPSRSLILTPFAAVHEPLGALRRAMAFVAATERITLPANLHPVLDELLGGQGITFDNAALLIAHQIQRHPGAPLPSLLLDDLTDLDEPSVEACARAIELLAGSVRVVARIDTMSQLPRNLARFSDGDEVALGRLDLEMGQELAAACTGDALEVGARGQWARRGGGTPLGIVEAVAAGIAQGELLWDGDALGRLKRTGGSDIARPVGYWIARRAEGLRQSSRDVLTALAHLGGEATVAELVDVVTAVVPLIDLQAEIVILRRGRWIREARPGTYVLVTRAQREAILEFSRNTQTRDWRTAIAKTIEKGPGTLRRAEAAQHAARAGMGEWAARLAMAAARTAAQVGLEESASTLAAFAASQDPGSANLDLGELPIEDEAEPPTVAMGPMSPETLSEFDVSIDPDPPELVEPIEALQPRQPPPPEPRDSPIPVSGEAEVENSPSLSYLGLLDSARDLRETRWAELARRSLVDGSAPARQRRGLLALARAYADEGRPAEALIQGLDALARMREARDAVGSRACLLFLARIYERTERPTDAVTLKSAAQAAS